MCRASWIAERSLAKWKIIIRKSRGNSRLLFQRFCRRPHLRMRIVGPRQLPDQSTPPANQDRPRLPRPMQWAVPFNAALQRGGLAQPSRSPGSEAARTPMGALQRPCERWGCTGVKRLLGDTSGSATRLRPPGRPGLEKVRSRFLSLLQDAVDASQAELPVVHHLADRSGEAAVLLVRQLSSRTQRAPLHQFAIRMLWNGSSELLVQQLKEVAYSFERLRIAIEPWQAAHSSETSAIWPYPQCFLTSRAAERRRGIT